MSRVVLVTGGTRGVGKGIADAFVANGDRVAVCGRTEPDVSQSDTPAVFFAADVRDPEQSAGLVRDILERFGQLDIVVNNAGGSPPSETATASVRFFEAIVRLNLIAPMMMCEFANQAMQEQPAGGSIINIGSLNGIRPSPGTAAYGAAKAGIINATETLSVAYAPKVRVNCVTPGAIATSDLHKLYGGDSYFAAVAATVPLGRMGLPQDVANACLFLTSPNADFITGTNLIVHGGGDSGAEIVLQQMTTN